MWEMYLRDVDSAAVPAYAAPGLGDVRNLPTAYIETAEFDPLRDEGLNFASALKASGQSPVLNETTGTIHGYDGSAGSEIARSSMQQRINFLNSVFASA